MQKSLFFGKVLHNMKKIIAFSLVFIVAISFGVFAYAEETEEQKLFDYSGFEQYANYEYDKFDDQWYYYEAYLKEYSDGNVIIGMDVNGYPNGKAQVNAPSLYVKVLDKNGKSLKTVTKIDFLIDDVKYSYNKMLEGDTTSSVFLATQGKALVEAIANSKSISVKITMGSSDLKIDLDQNQVDKTLKVISKALLENNVWDYLLESAEQFETAWPLTIKK